MNKKLISISILFLAVAMLAIFVLVTGKKDPVNKATGGQSQAQTTSDITLFYGDGCPHCALVEAYVSQNGVETKVSFTKKEVYFNKQNADELAEKAKACGMPTDSIGVPFLWDGSRCLVGDQDVINFFKAKLNVQ